MNKIKAEKEIIRLRQEIESHNYCYYVLSQPRISDKEYDSLLKRLVFLENQFPEFFDVNSPSQRVGVRLRHAGKTVQHRAKLYSLENTYSLNELRQWYARVRKILLNQEHDFVIELKIDGVSAAITYESGKLVQGATRGDGATGEDITSNVRTIRTLPLKLNNLKDFPYVFDVRAEIFMVREDFRILNLKRKKDNEPLFANPRNATSGTLKLLDPLVVSQRMLRCLVHSFGVKQGGIEIKDQWDFFRIAKDCGLPVSPHNRLCKSFDDVVEYCNEFQMKRHEIPYDVDGVVIKVNSFTQQNLLGSTLKSPRWAVAYKFPAQQATTVIEDIIVQVGRTGVLTPVAKLRPVQCAGVRITRATLHNFEEIDRLGIKIKDRVLLERAGDVIPKIVKVAVASEERKIFNMPTTCPECGDRIIKVKENEVAFRCPNPLCPAQLEKSIIHFASRQAMDIEGLGESVIKELLKRNLIKDLSDIYFLKKEDLLKLPLFKSKKADNLIINIQKSKKQPFSRLLFGLGIAHIGQKASLLIAERFQSMDCLMQAQPSDLIKIDEIGQVMADSLCRFFQKIETKKIIEKLKSTDVNMFQPKNVSNSNVFEGTRFIFTGEMKSLTRIQAVEIVHQRGGQADSKINKRIDYVVAGEKPGKKFKQAKKLGLKIINEQQFKEMIYDAQNQK